VRLAPTCVIVLPKKHVGPSQLCWSKHFPLAKSRTLWVSYISALRSTLLTLTVSCPTAPSTRKTLRCFYCTSRYSIAHSFMRYYLLTCPAFNSEPSLFGCPPQLQEGESCGWVLPQRIMCKSPFILRHRSLSYGCQTTQFLNQRTILPTTIRFGLIATFTKTIGDDLLCCAHYTMSRGLIGWDYTISRETLEDRMEFHLNLHIHDCSYLSVSVDFILQVWPNRI